RNRALRQRVGGAGGAVSDRLVGPGRAAARSPASGSGGIDGARALAELFEALPAAEDSRGAIERATHGAKLPQLPPHLSNRPTDDGPAGAVLRAGSGGGRPFPCPGCAA